MMERGLPVRDGSGEMFDGIAARYDVMNRVLSLGLDRRWRARAVRALELPTGGRALDVATGTGDLAMEIVRSDSGAAVVGLDPAPGMLAVARAKLESARLTERVELVEGSAERLPFPDASFDGVAIAFGIRNVPDRARALAEMARVTRAGRRVVVLELSEPRSGWLSPLARLHVRRVVPWLGGLLSASHEYRYLQRSIQAFPSVAEFASLMQAAGLEVLEVQALTLGAVQLYVARPRGRA